MTIVAQLISTSGAYGVHYIGSLPSAITIAGYDGTFGNPGKQVGGTTWTAYNLAGTQVGSGTMVATVTSFPVSSTTTWTGGGTIVPGWYQIVTNNASASSAYVCVCPGSPSGGSSNLWAASLTPTLTGASTQNMADFGAWAPGFPDRDFYQIPTLSAAQILANVQADPYYTTGDGVRTRYVWVSSSAQSSTSPTTAQWAAVATALSGAGFHAIYEIPTNEPENAGMNTAAIITAANAAHAAIIAVDASAKFAVFCSGGYNDTSFANWAPILAGLTFTPDFNSTHMEDSDENHADFVAFRQYFNGLASISPKPWIFTETGMTEVADSVLQARSGARQRTLFRLIAEMYGWPKETCYDFPIFDHWGSGLGTYQIEPVNQANSVGGNIRPGLYALHVMAEAFYKTTCPPAALSFGAAGSVGDSLFVGAHYAGVVNDVVVLGTNGVSGASVILSVPGYAASASITMWNGEGLPTTLTVSAAKTITVPVNDLLTYVFLTPSSSVSVVDTDQGVVTMGSRVNVIPLGTTKNGAAVAVTALNNGSFSESNTDVPGSSAPYHDTTVPDTITTTGLSALVYSFAIRSVQAGFFGGSNTSTPTAFTISINGSTVYTYSNATAQTFASRPSGDCAGGAAQATSTEYWDMTWSWAAAIVPVLITGSVVLNITVTSLGGIISGAGSGAQQINLSEFQMYVLPSVTSSVAIPANLGRPNGARF